MTSSCVGQFGLSSLGFLPSNERREECPRNEDPGCGQAPVRHWWGLVSPSPSCSASPSLLTWKPCCWIFLQSLGVVWSNVSYSFSSVWHLESSLLLQKDLFHTDGCPFWMLLWTPCVCLMHSFCTVHCQFHPFEGRRNLPRDSRWSSEEKGCQWHRKEVCWWNTTDYQEEVVSLHKGR